MSIGERIRSRREELGLSQEELALKLGYKNRSSINKIEQDKQNLRQSKIKAIADALETTPAYVMGWSDFTSKEEEEMVKTLCEEHQMIQADYAGISLEALQFAQRFEKLDEESKRQLVLMLAFLKDQENKK